MMSPGFGYTGTN